MLAPLTPCPDAAGVHETCVMPLPTIAVSPHPPATQPQAIPETATSAPLDDALAQAPVGPLMARWRLQAQQQEAEHAARLAALVPPALATPIADSQAAARHRQIGAHLRREALGAMQALRAPQGARWDAACASVQQALNEWDAVKRPDGHHAVMLGPKLALTARGIGIVEYKTSFYNVCEEERLALQLGPLYASQAAFVAQAHQRLAGIVTDAATCGAFAQHVCVLAAASTFSPLGTAPLSDRAKAAAIVGVGVTAATLAPWLIGDSSASVCAIFGGSFAQLANIVLNPAQKRLSLLGTQAAASDAWMSCVKQALSEAPVPAPNEYVLHALPAGEDALPQSMQDLEQALRTGLAAQYLPSPMAREDVQSVTALKAAMARAAEPIRARARHLVSLLREPAHWAHDATFQDLQTYLAALDAHGPGGPRSLSLFGEFDVSHRGFGWRRSLFRNSRFHSDDGAAMPLAQLDVDDATFLAGVRKRLSHLAADLACAPDGEPSKLLRTCTSPGWHIPGPVSLPVQHSPQWVDRLSFVGTATFYAGSIGGAFGLGGGAFTGVPALEATRNGALILSGVVCVMATTMLLDMGGGQEPDAHDVTLAWHAYANGEWPQVGIWELDLSAELAQV